MPCQPKASYGNRLGDSGKKERISRRLPRRDHVQRPHRDEREDDQDDRLNELLRFDQARYVCSYNRIHVRLVLIRHVTPHRPV